MLTCKFVCLSVCACQVQETKVELSGLGDRMEEVRSICRQLHAQLRHIPECNLVSFEGEADALMDRWLDVSSSHLWLFLQFASVRHSIIHPTFTEKKITCVSKHFEQTKNPTALVGRKVEQHLICLH